MVKFEDSLIKKCKQTNDGSKRFASNEIML